MRLRFVFPVLISFALILSSGFTILSSSGMTLATGSPIDGRTCGDCHSGSGSATPSVTITSSPAFGSGNTYVAANLYTITVSCSGTFPKFGFDIEFLNSTSPISAVDAGIFGPAISNCKKVVATGSPTNYTHLSPTGTASVATFQFQWTAPDSGNVFIYNVCLGVNNNGNANGDHLKLTNIVLTQDLSGINGYEENRTELIISPNPATENVRITYTLSERGRVNLKLTSLDGEQIADLLNEIQGKGAQSADARLPLGLAKGMYMVKLYINGKQSMQKLMIL